MEVHCTIYKVLHFDLLTAPVHLRFLFMWKQDFADGLYKHAKLGIKILCTIDSCQKTNFYDNIGQIISVLYLHLHFFLSLHLHYVDNYFADFD